MNPIVLETVKMAAESHMALLILLLVLTVLLYYRAITDAKIPDKYKMPTMLALIATFFILLFTFINKGCDHRFQQAMEPPQNEYKQQRNQGQK